jgi:hypothetical protein
MIDSNEHRVLAVDHSLGFLGHDLRLGHSEDAAHGGHNFSELLKTVRRKCESRVRVRGARVSVRHGRMSMRNTDTCEAQGCVWGTRMSMSNTDEYEGTRMSMRKKHVARVIAQILEIERLDKGTNEGSGEKKQANVGCVWSAGRKTVIVGKKRMKCNQSQRSL